MEDVFPGHTPEPYLVSVSDPYDADSPFHRWLVPLTDEALSQRFEHPVDDVRVTHVGPGIASSVTLLGPRGSRTLTPTEFVQALSLRSLRFAVSVLSLDAPPPVRSGRPVVLHGFLRGIGGVELQQRLPYGSWRRVRLVHARADGRFVATLHPVGSTAYRLAVDGIAGPAVEVTVTRPSHG